VSADSLDLLETLYRVAKQAGDDLSGLPGALQEAVGPAKVTAARAVGAAGGVGPTAAGATMTGAQQAGGATPATSGTVGAVGSLDDHLAQYGITNEGFWSNTWDLFTSPVEHLGGMWHSWWALDEFEQLLGDAKDDLTRMGGDLDTAVDAVDRLVEISRSGGVEDLEQALKDLERVQTGLRHHHQNAPSDWKAANQGRFDDRMAHIDRKRAAITDLLLALRQWRAIGPRLAATLRGLETTPSGETRSALEYIDPAIASGLSQTAYALEGLTYGVTGGGAAGDRSPPPSWEDIKAAADAQAHQWNESLDDEYDPATDPDLDGLGGSE
jgi:hypothetical protein